MARLDLAAQSILEQSDGGSCDALFELGLMYSAGRGVELDLISAHKWFNLSALRGNAHARGLRQEIAREMTRGQVSEAQRQARQWLRTP